MTRAPAVVSRSSTRYPLGPRRRLPKDDRPRLVYMLSGNGEVHTQKRLMLATNRARRPSQRLQPLPRALRGPRHDSRGTTIRPGYPSTSLPTTIDARWGQFRPSRWGQRKPSFPTIHNLLKLHRAGGLMLVNSS
jgi:hypothetical protein